MLSRVLLLLTMCVSRYAVGFEILSPSVITAFLSGHNQLRSSLGLPKLVWNSSLISVAEKDIGYCYFYEGGNSYSTLSNKPDNVAKANDAVASWRSEAIKVDPAWACISDESCRSYSQLVWKNTTSVGCAMFNCGDDDATLVKCAYYLKGNVDGEIPY